MKKTYDDDSGSVADAFSEALTHFPLKARIYASPTVCGVWRLNPSGHHQAAFHLITSGNCWFHQKETPPLQLTAGDIVFVARDCWHVFSSESTIGDDSTLWDHSDAGPALSLICGAVEFPDGTGQAFLAGLPDLVVIAATALNDRERVQALGRLMAIEVEAGDCGGDVVLDRLADVLVVMVLRHLMHTGVARHGLLAALADPYLSRALIRIHRDYQEDWTLASLAACAGLSRSAFARRFVDNIGDTPINYLAAWRMHHAERWLRERRYSVSQISARLGYDTEAAFRRAFKRIRGVAPGQVRRLSGNAERPA